MNYINFRTLVTGQQLKWFYKQTPNGYEFSTFDGPLVFTCVIYGDSCTITGAEKHQEYVDDFEMNHKYSALNVG